MTYSLYAPDPTAAHGIELPFNKTNHIVIAEDDEDEFLLISEAFEEFCPQVNLIWVKNGNDLLDYLETSDKNLATILMDINMPKKTGLEALQEIRANGHYDAIPIIVFTTATSDETMRYVQSFKKTTFAVKPVGYQAYVGFIKTFA